MQLARPPSWLPKQGAEIERDVMRRVGEVRWRGVPMEINGQWCALDAFYVFCVELQGSFEKRGSFLMN